MNPRPKFCVGEEVMAICLNQPNIPRTEILSMGYRNDVLDDTGEYYTGWRYEVAEARPDTTIREENLRKLPPKADPWKDCIFQPLKLTA